MNTTQYIAKCTNTPQPVQTEYPLVHYQNFHFIQPSSTIRPNKRYQNLNSSNKNTNFIQKDDQQNLSLSIPKSSQPDMLWKTQMSQSFVQKLQIFDDQQESLTTQNFNTQLFTKANLKNRINLAQGQIIDLKAFFNEVKQKMLQMHKVYSEGNKKSIELVMLIVKQLQKQNSILKQKLSAINQMHLSRSIKSVQYRDFMGQTELISCHQKDKDPTEYKGESIKQVEIQHTVQASQDMTDQSQDPQHSDKIQVSPVWSVLLAEYQLETIQQLEHDDSTCSLLSHKINPFNEGPNTFQSKLDVTDRVSVLNESHVQSFNFQEVTNLFTENRHRNTPKICQQNDTSENRVCDKVKIQENLIPQKNPNENSLKQNSFQEDEEQSLIVKKLLKLNKINNRKNSLSLTNSKISSIGQNQNLKPNLNQVFANISIPTIPIGQNPHSISQALTILKEYNKNSVQKHVNLDQNKKQNQNQKQPKPKGPGKISLFANKKIQNKENIPDSQKF